MNDLAPAARADDGDALLVSLLEAHTVPWDTLHARYAPLLGLVRAMIGVVPNCDPYLEIWPPGFRSYNLVVPAFLNMPVSLLGVGGGPSAALVGMSMYVSSRAAECPYCSAHTCSFALRRGASPEKLAQALVGGDAPFTAAELATIAVARSIARVPCELTAEERAALERSVGPASAEWVVLGAVMMGFLNKVMDALGVELEPSTAAEVATTMGSPSFGKAGRNLDPAHREPPPPRDSLATKLRILPLLPGALRLDLGWQRGVPGAWPAAGRFLRERTGHDFPVLARLRHGRVVKCIATMLRDNLDARTTVVGLDTKVLAGVIFARVVGDEALERDMRALAPRYALTQAQLDEAARFALDPVATPPGDDAKTRAALCLARAASPSPVEVDAELVAACRDAELAPAAIVELVCWLAVLQMMHRLTSWFAVA